MRSHLYSPDIQEDFLGGEKKMKLFRKGQGATEYLLMLAAVLVIVAIAVYYVMGTAGTPTIVASAKLSGNKVWIRGETGCSVVADWSFEYKGGSTITEWQSKSGSMGPGDEIELTALANVVGIGDTVTIRYDTTVKSAVINQLDQWTPLG